MSRFWVWIVGLLVVIIVGAVAGLTWLTAPALVGRCEVHFVDVGQGDAAVVITPRGKVVVIDGGPQDSGLAEYLGQLGTKNIDVVVATHAHSDHLSGLEEVLGKFPVDVVVGNEYERASWVYSEFVDAVEGSEATFFQVARGSVIMVDGIEFMVLGPEKGFPDDNLNETSLVLQMECGGVTFLFAGDAGETSEYLARKDGLLSDVDVLKVGHHASASGTSGFFLDLVKPELGVISVGTNDSNLPNAEVVDRLREKGVEVLMTRDVGTVVVLAKWGRWWVKENVGSEGK